MRGSLDRWRRKLCSEIEARFVEEPYAHWARSSTSTVSSGRRWPSSRDVVQDPQLRHQHAFATIPRPDGPIETVAVPFGIDGADIGVRGPSPQAGADTFDVLQAAGLSADEIAQFAADGVLG